MRKLLDALLLPAKRWVVISIAAAALMLGLFWIFGGMPDKGEPLLTTLVVSLLWFWGVVLVLFIQVKNPSCPEWFLNLFELAMLVVFGAAWIVSCVNFLLHLQNGFSPAVCVCAVTWGAVSFAHSKRKMPPPMDAQ